MQSIKVEKIKNLYDLFSDDISKYIFENRLLYSLTEDTKFIRNVVCTIGKGKEIYERMCSSSGKIGIFGAGDVGRHLIQVYRDIEFVCFIDNKKIGETYQGLPVISLDDFKLRYSRGVIVISTKLFYREIIAQLLQANIEEDKIINLGMEYAKLNALQYFDLSHLGKWKKEKEVFVDGGSYDGLTALNFINWCGGGKYLHGNLTQIIKKM